MFSAWFVTAIPYKQYVVGNNRRAALPGNELGNPYGNVVVALIKDPILKSY